MADPFIVYYRQGGTLECSWQKTLARFASRDDALASVSRLERMGYRALYARKSVLDKIGLPIGWTADDVDHARDKITYTPDRTEWRSHAADLYR